MIEIKIGQYRSWEESEEKRATHGRPWCEASGKVPHDESQGVRSVGRDSWTLDTLTSRKENQATDGDGYGWVPVRTALAVLVATPYWSTAGLESALESALKRS